MSSILTTLVVLVLTVIAFIPKENKTLSILSYGLCIPGWIILTFILANLTWSSGNTYFATGIAIFGAIIVFVFVGITAMMAFDAQLHPESYEQLKAQKRENIYQLTKTKEKEWPY